MITTHHGSIFDSTADVLVCPVNCVGVMGKGLALEFRWRYPEAGKYYLSLCRRKFIIPGAALWLGSGVVCVATKDNWRNSSEIRWVTTGLECLFKMIDAHKIESIAIPQLGCGCGGLDWKDVEPLIHQHLGDLPVNVEVWIYE